MAGTGTLLFAITVFRQVLRFSILLIWWVLGHVSNGTEQFVPVIMFLTFIWGVLGLSLSWEEHCAASPTPNAGS
jgi:hypothetical protein